MDVTSYAAIPYPSDTDALSSWPQTLSALAHIIETLLPVTGTKVTGNHTIGTIKTTPVTFPVPYPAGEIPRVFVETNNVANPDGVNASVNNVTVTGFDLQTVRSVGTGPMTVQWMAVASV